MNNILHTKYIHRITFVSAVSVSPAAAGYSYTQKRDFWEKFVYQPGLSDWENSKKENNEDEKNDENGE